MISTIVQTPARLFHALQGKRPRSHGAFRWRIGVLIAIGLRGLPTAGFVATNHLLRQTDERRAQRSNAQAAMSVADEIAQSYRQRLQVLQDLTQNSVLVAGLSNHNRPASEQNLQAALRDGSYCHLVLRAPDVDPVDVSGPGTVLGVF